MFESASENEGTDPRVCCMFEGKLRMKRKEISRKPFSMKPDYRCVNRMDSVDPHPLY